MAGEEGISFSAEGKLDRNMTTTGSTKDLPRDPQVEDGDLLDDTWWEHKSGFGIPPGTLELVEVKKREWRRLMQLPLPPSVEAPILQEFSRPWRTLRLPIPDAPSEETKAGISLMKSYEPQYTPGESTFASEIHTSSFLEPRTAVPEAQAFLITPRIRFALGTVEPLICKMLVYDLSFGCRATEEFCFRIEPTLEKTANAISPAALVYVLPTVQIQNLHLLLKVSKVLVGDGDIATAPYCAPDKFASPSEQQKLVERAMDCGVRLGRFQQPLAWGTIPLAKGSKRPMTLYRQRACIPEELRVSLISEAVRGALKEKIIPAVCEFDVEELQLDELAEAKFKTTNNSSNPVPRLDITDPFSDHSVHNSEKPVEPKAEKLVRCREVQPFCTSSLVPKFGIAGSGPVAISYVNVLYLYPLQIDKCQYRNVAIRIQLLQNEVDSVRGIEETEDAVLRAVYRANNQVDRSAYALVGYHQKNPQFEDEIKICLPECLTVEHHLLFTFYHVHCKKLQSNQQQQELVGCAVLPILEKNGTIIQDGKYTMNMTPAPLSSKPSVTGGGISLSPGYVNAARNGVLDNNKSIFCCRSRVISSIHSQDPAVANFLSPFHGNPRLDSVNNEEVIANRLMGLRQSSAPNVRFFFLTIARFVLGYLRYGTSIVRWSAFRTLLSIMEKASWNPQGSLKLHEMNRVLHDFVHIVYDENSIDDPCARSASTAPLSSERKSVFGALLETWLNVLNNKASIEENADTKRMSLTYSNVLLQLILKSMAMKLLDQRDTAHSLPTKLAENDEVMFERLLQQLISCAGDTSNGLLLQKEVNRSVGYVCRGVFLIAKNVFPARVINRYVKWIDVQGDANSLRHIWFPFLHILVDFEYFPTVNGAMSSTAKTPGQGRAWLAKAIFEKLLLIIDTQKELKIRVDAVRLLRRMFAAQVYNPRFQGPEHQENIALLYYPLFPSLAQFTTSGKLLASCVASNSVATGGEVKSMADLQKEILACVGHLLCSVSKAQLPLFFRPHCETTSPNQPTRLNFTEALAFYHRVLATVDRERMRSNGLPKQDEPFDNNSESIPIPVEMVMQNSWYDEARVHASLALIQRIVDVFLVTSPSMTNGEKRSHQLLSPDLSTPDNETGLSLLEHRLAHRRSSHRRTGGNFETPAMLPAKTDSPNDNMTDGNTAHRSLPRNWSKQYTNVQQRRSVPSGPDEKAVPNSPNQTHECAPGGEHDEEIAALQQATAVTALQVIETAVGQYEAVIRLIEVARTPHLGTTGMSGDPLLKGVSPNQGFILLCFITELLFQLLQQSSCISCLTGETEIGDKEEQQTEEIASNSDGTRLPCFMVTLLRYLQAFVWRFSAALFAVRIAGIPLVHDQCRIQLIVSIATTAKTFVVRRHAAMLLSQLLAVSYEQTGSFLPVKGPILKVLTLIFFPPPSKPVPNVISTASLRDLLDEMRTFATTSRDHALHLPLSFHIQFMELLNDLTTKVHAYERWHGAFDNPNGAHDFEEIEEGIDRVIDDISPHWLLDEKLVWLNALLRLHICRGRFAEAVCCKVAAIEYVQRAGVGSDNSNNGRVQQWVVRELFIARGYAEQADWIEKELSICEILLVCLKQQRRFNEYQEMLRCMGTLAGRLAERQESGGTPHNSSNFSFYRVQYAGGCVPALIARDEFIYKRSKFMSLGEVVGEMKMMLRAKYPQCERVDVVLEPKPLTGVDSNPNVIFLRVTTVEEALPEDLLRMTQSRNHNWRVAFRFAVPFTLGSASSYGKTSEQMKRITFLSVGRTFPCRLNRQRVQLRHDEVRCPIENSMEDIQRRCTLLRAEVDKENVGKTDLKTLTLVLKGSVDTHVHGGIPEVLDSFLADSPAQLVNSEGRAMSSQESLQIRHKLANLLVEFAQLCWQCLVISREAYRRSSQPNSHQLPLLLSPPPTPIQPELMPHHFAFNKSDSANDTFLPPLQTNLLSRHLATSSVRIPLDTEPSLPLLQVSPLQTEFERSFALLVDQIKTKIPFTYKNTAKLHHLHHQTAGLRVKQPAPPLSPAPVAPLPDTAH